MSVTSDDAVNTDPVRIPAAEEIDELRQEIDHLDAEILRLVKRRSEVSRLIGAARMAAGGPGSSTTGRWRCWPGSASWAPRAASWACCCCGWAADAWAAAESDRGRELRTALHAGPPRDVAVWWAWERLSGSSQG